MNNLEFRVWNPQTNKFVTDSGKGMWFLNLDGNVCQAEYPCGNGDNSADSVFSPYENVEFIIQQYTGLKDKNDKKIFEGDILRINTFISEVKFGRYSDGEGYGHLGWFLLNKENIKYSLGPDECDSFIYPGEIIGNNRENPELLK